MRESRAKRRNRKAREDASGDHTPDVEDEKLGLELDVLADASGVGSVKKPVTALEQVSDLPRNPYERATELLYFLCSTCQHFECNKKQGGKKRRVIKLIGR